jgi:hypothetical protein
MPAGLPRIAAGTWGMRTPTIAAKARKAIRPMAKRTDVSSRHGQRTGSNSMRRVRPAAAFAI